MPTSPHWTPATTQPRVTPGYRRGMLLRLVTDMRDVRRRRIPAGTVVRLARRLADHMWEAVDSEWTTLILAEATLDQCAEVLQ